jgi:predicted DNA-binding transcriptional regulator YafY
MADTSARMLRLLSLLQTHRHWPGPELAARLDVSARTLRRDVDRLRELGYPVGASRGLDGGYQLGAGATLPPLVLDDDEAVALAVGLRTASRSAVEGVAESSVRALAKVVQVMPSRLRRRVEALTDMTTGLSWQPASTGTPAIAVHLLTDLAVACRDTERMRFAYTSASGETTNRYAEPHRMVSIGRRWYLVAYDLGRHDWRSFRLDRMSGLASTGEPFRPRELPATDAATFVRSGIEQRARPHEVVALVEAPEALLRERIGSWSDIRAIDESRCRVTMTADSLEWPAMALGVTGAPFTVESPPAMHALLADWSRRFAEATT